MVEPALSPEDEEFLKNWYAVTFHVPREDIDDQTKKGHYNYHEFMGDHARPSNKPHNRQLLAFIAGPSGRPNERTDPTGATSDRQRSLVIHAWQLHHHSCNTDRENANERRQHMELTIVLGIAMVTFFLLLADALLQEDTGSTIVYATSAILFFFATAYEGAKWRGPPSLANE